MPITIAYTDVHRQFTSPMLAVDNSVVGLQGYTPAIWSADDGGALISLNPLGDPVGDLQVIMKGVPGSFNLTATHTRAGSPDISKTVEVLITGAAPDHTDILLVPLQA